MRYPALCVGVFLSVTPLAAQDIAPERTAIKQASGPNLKAVLFRPAGTGPFPAIVALHGCSGLASASEIRPNRDSDWGKRLANQGFVVLFPDSFGSRGLGSQCSVRERAVRPGVERVADANAAKAWLQDRKDVIANRVSLLGWSNGGSTVLWAAATKNKPLDERPDFHTAIAFYPGCRPVLEAAARREWVSRLPLLVLIGEADNWTPAAPCKALVPMMYGYAQKITLKTYPNAVHTFDHPDLKLRKRTGLAYTGDGSGEAMIGTDPAARADAIQQVPAFLRQ